MTDTSTPPGRGHQTSYDEVPYASHPFPQTHPDRLATVATLFGLRPPPVQRCRVLELGCASGGNLIPMAEQLPEGRFLGIDLSARQIADGQAIIDQLGLGNIELRHASILEVDEGFGKFDYIICHGVYSWVPARVQEKILEVAKRNLAANGITYVSYNTYPGWHMRGMVRAIMRYHAQKFTLPRDRTMQARALLEFLAGSVKQDGGAYATLLRTELESLQRHTDSYLFHEHLEEVNDPVFFFEFIERAQAQGLQYLAEVNLAAMAVSSFQPDVAKTLRVLAPDQIQAEQYMDFLRNRTFRQTLLCHRESPVNWSIQPEALHRLHVASQSVAVVEPERLQDKGSVTFRTPSRQTLASTNPFLNYAIPCLHECWPHALPFDRLLEMVRTRLRVSTSTTPPSGNEQQLLSLGLLNGFIGPDLVELHAAQVNCATSVAQRPVASALARLQAKSGALVTNRRHEAIRLHDLERKLLPLLDGQHDRPALLSELVNGALAGQLEVQQGEAVLQDATAIRTALEGMLNSSLTGLVGKSLLIG